MPTVWRHTPNTTTLDRRNVGGYGLVPHSIGKLRNPFKCIAVYTPNSASNQHFIVELWLHSIHYIHADFLALLQTQERLCYERFRSVDRMSSSVCPNFSKSNYSHIFWDRSFIFSEIIGLPKGNKLLGPDFFWGGRWGAGALKWSLIALVC